jgi:hypothetical protein
MPSWKPLGERVMRPNPPIFLRYACGHVRKEFRGQMSEDLRRRVIATCSTQPCDKCKGIRKPSGPPTPPLDWD